MSEISKNVNDKIALERHDFTMRALKAVFTLGVAAVLALLSLYIFSLFGSGELPEADDVVTLIGSIFSMISSAL